MDISPTFKLTAESIMEYVREYKEHLTTSSHGESKSTPLHHAPVANQ